MMMLTQCTAVSRSCHSGRASEREREPESSNPRPCYCAMLRHRTVGVYWVPAFAGTTTEMFPSSCPEIRRGDCLAREACGGAGERDAALLQAIDVACGLKRLDDVLLDNDQRTAFAQNGRQTGIDFADHDP